MLRRIVLEILIHIYKAVAVVHVSVFVWLAVVLAQEVVEKPLVRGDVVLLQVEALALEVVGTALMILQETLMEHLVIAALVVVIVLLLA